MATAIWQHLSLSANDQLKNQSLTCPHPDKTSSAKFVQNGERTLLHRVGDQNQQAEDIREVPEVAPQGQDGHDE